MGRRRKTNKHLPQRVYQYHGRYWFIERSGKRRDLGTTEAEMYSKLAEFADRRTPLPTTRPAGKKSGIMSYDISQRCAYFTAAEIFHTARDISRAMLVRDSQPIV
jgi:hypothetical protein